MEIWTILKQKLTRLIFSNPSELLNPIQELEAQIEKIKQDNPDWENEYSLEGTPKGEITKLEVQKSIAQQKLAYQQNWTDDKAGYEKQLVVMTDKWNTNEKKLEKVRDLVASDNLERLKSLIRKGEI